METKCQLTWNISTIWLMLKYIELEKCLCFFLLKSLYIDKDRVLDLKKLWVYVALDQTIKST